MAARRSGVDSLGVAVAISPRYQRDSSSTAQANIVWPVTASRCPGNALQQQSQSVVIYSREPDGWRLAIDAPWGLPQA
jgi:hypothetical protein